MAKNQINQDIHEANQDAFDAYEQLPQSYFDDKRWQQVKELRAQGEHAKANGLVLTIRDDYGFEG